MPYQLPTEKEYPTINITQEILSQLSNLGIAHSTKVVDRIVRAHGQTLHDIYTLRNSVFERIPDVVVWPDSHEDVVKIVTFATEHEMVIIPFGGGTAVSGAVECPSNESRTIISLDTSQMNRILWLDKNNLIACCESGIIGQDLERELAKLGFTTGHEPDSYEFSSLGGWVATRASGKLILRIYFINILLFVIRGLWRSSCWGNIGHDTFTIHLACESTLIDEVKT